MRFVKAGEQESDLDLVEDELMDVELDDIIRRWPRRIWIAPWLVR